MRYHPLSPGHRARLRCGCASASRPARRAWGGCYAVDAGVEGWLRAVAGRLVDPGWAWITESTPAGDATSRPSLCRGADRRVAAEELLNELVQQMLRGPVQMLGITVPRIAVGLAAVPPQPRADDAEGIDPEIGRTGSGIGHRGEHLSTA